MIIRVISGLYVLMISTNNYSPGNFKKLLTGFACFLLLALSNGVLAQQAPFYTPPKVSRRVLNRERQDSLQNFKRPQRALIEFGASEIVPWSLDNFVRGTDYTKISWKTVSYNLNPGHWAWDNDNFQTNQFGHPYHGSLFFNSFRTNGYSFWQSVPVAFAGSYVWETFAENQAPAPNDFINTSFGGIVLGEMTYRLSNKIVNNHTTGLKRQLSEIAGLIISPTNGLNRLMDGKWGKRSSNTLEQDSSKITASFDAGYRQFNRNKSGLFNNGVYEGWYLHAQLLYGSAYDNFRKPFTNIIINAEIGKDDSTLLNNVSVYGSLTGWQLNNGEVVKHLLVLSANYDYLHNASFFYGSESVKFNLYSQFEPTKKVTINTTVGAGPILLAAIPDAYPISNGRNYDYGSGVSYNAGAKLSLANRFFVTANYRGAATWTLNGNRSHYLLHGLSTEFSCRLVGNLAVNAEPGYYYLHGIYANYADVDKKYPYFKLSARFTVKNK